VVEAGQQALVQEQRVAGREGGEAGCAAGRVFRVARVFRVFRVFLVARVAGGVVGDQLDPGAADRLVVLLRRARIPGGAPDAVADQADRGGHAVPADRQPGQLNVLPVAEPAAGAGQDLGHQGIETAVRG
jgi:hypothetical protein